MLVYPKSLETPEVTETSRVDNELAEKPVTDRKLTPMERLDQARAATLRPRTTTQA